MSNNRVSRNKIGFNHTRIDKSQTIAEKINRIENDLYNIPIVLTHAMNKQREEIDTRMTNEVSQLDAKLLQLAEEKANENKALHDKIASLEVTLSDMAAKMIELTETMGKKSQDEAAKLQQTISTLEANIKDIVTLDFDRFKLSLSDLKSSMDITDQKSDNLTREIAGILMTSKEVADVNVDPTKHLVDMMQLDVILRNTRVSISALESAVEANSSEYNAVKQHIETFVKLNTKQSAAYSGDPSVLLFTSKHSGDLVDLQHRCTSTEARIKQLRTAIAKMKESVNFHDVALSTKFVALNQITTTKSTVSDLTSTVNDLSKGLSDVKQISENAITAANAAAAEASAIAAATPAVSAADSEANAEQMNQITQRIGKVEKSVNKLSKQQSVLQQQHTESLLNIAAPMDTDAVGTANDAPLADLEAKLRPLIAKMVEAGLQRAIPAGEKAERVLSAKASQKPSRPPPVAGMSPKRHAPGPSTPVVAFPGAAGVTAVTITTGGGTNPNSRKNSINGILPSTLPPVSSPVPSAARGLSKMAFNDDSTVNSLAGPAEGEG